MICVMAASGEVGKGTVAALLAQGVDPASIVAAARNPEPLNTLNTEALNFRRADYRDEASMRTAFRGVETLILIPTKTPAAPRCNEHANALAAARAAGVKRVVFLSIQAATPASLFDVAPFILFAECATRQSGLRWTLARMSLYTDPIAEWAPELARTERLPYPLRDARIAYVSRRDVSQALAAIARSDNLNGEILELTGPAALSIPELAQAVSKATGSTVLFQSIGEEEYREICRKDNLPDEIVDILVTMYRAAEAQEFSRVTKDILALTGKASESMPDALARLLGHQSQP
ncbi:MAG TPA: NAD(P)H-binding protein [Bryobacteraceae bacterium]|nr:NAD(P)H-binding protein [Bryobacteraceae bacterium]